MTTENGKSMESRASVDGETMERQGETPPEVKVEEKPATSVSHVSTRITMRVSCPVDLGMNRPDRTRWGHVTAEAAIELGGSKKDVNAVIFERVRKDLDYAMSHAVRDAKTMADKNYGN